MEPRTTKSFRDAADRIVRQESSLTPPISRLLGTHPRAARAAATEAEASDVRLTALATLGQYDALTFVVDDAQPRTTYNLDEDPTEEPAIRDAVGEAIRSGATAQLRVAVPLADGRMATAVLVSPLAGAEAPVGALVALRVGRPFAAVDAHAAVAIAELASLEFARAATARRETADRRQALALYELTRHALFADDIDDALHGIAMVLASALDHDAAHVWLRHPDGTLRRHAAHPHDGSEPGPLWADDHEALWGALRERRLVRLSQTTPAGWLPSGTTHALVVPLRGERRPIGVLILARAASPYGPNDIEMADVIGMFVGRIVSSTDTGAADSALNVARSIRELEGEEELA